MNFKWMIALQIFVFSLCAGQTTRTFTNPIIHADYSDPDVIRVGDDFYMVASSFAHVPGLPVLYSRDLVHWKLLGHAVPKLPAPLYDKPQHGKGIWAPSIRFHQGEYWIYYGDPDLGIFLVKSKNPAGPWDPPILVHEAKGWIDPCPFWDDDGQAWLVHAWAKSRVGFNSILTLHRMSADGEKVLDEGVTVFDGHDLHPTIEGPKMYKRDGMYYIFAPAGGVKPGWQTVLRSTTIQGPYEDKIVLEQGTTPINGPHQGGWVELANGESWFIHFQDQDAYGRIIHLQPMSWQKGWPMMGIDIDGNGIGEPVLSYKMPTTDHAGEQEIAASDDFSAGTLGVQWQWQANVDHNWYTLDANKGFLRLYAMSPDSGFRNLWDLANIVAQKFPARQFTVIAKLSFHPGQAGDVAGMVVFGSDYATLRLAPQGNGFTLQQRVCLAAEKGSAEEIVAAAQLNQGDIFLKVSVKDNAICSFAYSLDGSDFSPIGPDLTAKAGRWVGAKLGFFSTTTPGAKSKGYVDIDFIRVTSN